MEEKVANLTTGQGQQNVIFARHFIQRGARPFVVKSTTMMSASSVSAYMHAWLLVSLMMYIVTMPEREYVDLLSKVVDPFNLKTYM